jgi:hypothetical protein
MMFNFSLHFLGASITVIVTAMCVAQHLEFFMVKLRINLVEQYYGNQTQKKSRRFLPLTKVKEINGRGWS